MIKKGDMVVVLTGKDKGKQAKVLQVFKKNNKILLEGMNIFKRHERSRKQGKKGQIIERVMPMEISNVSLYCTKCKKGARIGIKIGKNGQKTRVCKKCNSNL